MAARELAREGKRVTIVEARDRCGGRIHPLPSADFGYSYATPETRAAQAALSRIDGAVFFSGEALYRGRDMGTVEAALASGLATARTLLG